MPELAMTSSSWERRTLPLWLTSLCRYRMRRSRVKFHFRLLRPPQKNCAQSVSGSFETFPSSHGCGPPSLHSSGDNTSDPEDCLADIACQRLCLRLRERTDSHARIPCPSSLASERSADAVAPVLPPSTPRPAARSRRPCTRRLTWERSTDTPPPVPMPGSPPASR